MKKCSLCGGDLDYNKRCTFCGLDNTKNDDMYKHLINRNACADEPLTHVHTEPTNTYVPTYKMMKKKRSSPRGVVGVVVAIIVMVIAFGSSFFEFVENLVVDEFDSSYSEETENDPYAYVDYDLPESGMEYSITLEPGIYTVGVHLPEGTYAASAATGNYGMIEINDSGNGIYLYRNIGLEDEETETSDLRLYKDGHFIVSTGITVTMNSYNVQNTELFTKPNGLVNEVVIGSTAKVAGEDFPVGVYDILYTAGDEEDYSNVDYQVPMDGYEAFYSIYFGDAGMTERYHNVVFIEGTKINVSGGTNVTLVPSERIGTEDVSDFYEKFF